MWMKQGLFIKCYTDMELRKTKLTAKYSFRKNQITQIINGRICISLLDLYVYKKQISINRMKTSK